MKLIEKIAVLRANGVGDLVFGLPALQALRTAYPQTEIVYLGCPWHREFLPGRVNSIDRVEVVPVSRGVREELGKVENPTAIMAFFKRMKAEKFDLALQLHGGGKYSNPFVKKLGAKTTAGLRAEGAPPLDINVPYVYYQSEYFRYLEVVAAVGAKKQLWWPRLRVLKTDESEAAKFLGKDKTYAVLHPGATDRRRRWPDWKMARVGDWLAGQGYLVVITGTRAEAGVVEAVRAKMTARAKKAVGKLSLGGLLGLIDKAAIMVSNDTGPFHLAVALDRPAIGIFWCGNMITAAPMTRTKQRVAIAWQTHCPRCGADVAAPGYPFWGVQNGCEHEVSFVETVAVEEVIGELKRSLVAGGKNNGHKDLDGTVIHDESLVPAAALGP